MTIATTNSLSCIHKGHNIWKERVSKVPTLSEVTREYILKVVLVGESADFRYLDFFEQGVSNMKTGLIISRHL